MVLQRRIGEIGASAAAEGAGRSVLACVCVRKGPDDRGLRAVSINEDEQINPDAADASCFLSRWQALFKIKKGDSNIGSDATEFSLSCLSGIP